MDPYRERLLAFDAWEERVQAFRARPFPTEWAKVVNGVGLASFAMRTERTLPNLSGMAIWKSHYLLGTRKPQTIVAELRAVEAGFATFMPALPPEPRAYFEELRTLVADAIELARVWWGVGEPVGPGEGR